MAHCAGLLALGSLAWLGCATPHVDPTVAVEDAPPFSPSGEFEVEDRWWTEFQDPLLADQIDVALRANYDLDATWQRVIAARALAWQAASPLFPQLNGVVDVGGAFGPGDDSSNFGFGLDASYQANLWGRISSQYEAQRLQAAASQSDYQSVALILSSQIASTWFQLMEARAQAVLVQEQIETNERGVELIEARFGVQTRLADVLRQRQLAQSTQEQLVVVQARIELLEHQLAVLQGQPPQEMTYDTGANLPDLPPLPATGLPSELLQRRPDVRRAYLSLLSADRELAAAIAAQYPRVNLAASLATAAESPDTLFRDWFASIAGQLVAPVFNAGLLRSEVRRTEAVTRQRVAEYGQTILQAYQEVENSLTQEKYARQRLALLDSQVQLAEQTSERLLDVYFQNETDYLNVLTAISNQQRLQRQFLSTKLELVLARIALYRALSGSFLDRPLPEEPLLEQPVDEE